MGLRGLFPSLVVFLILMMVFGTQRLRDVGSDLAIAIKNFRKGMQDDDKADVKADEGSKE